jgi:hypothetical protein
MATSRFTSYDFSDYDRAAAKVRAVKGKARLSPSEAADVRAAVARHETRAARGRSQPSRTRSTLLAQIQAEVSGQVTPIVERLYRTASSRWAGGDTIVTVRRGNAPSASGESRRVWSDNGKWSGQNALLTVTVALDWRSAVQGAGLAVIDGELTTHATPTSADCWEGAWVKQGRGFDLTVVRGHIIRAANGRLYKSATEAAARGKARKAEGKLPKTTARQVALAVKPISEAAAQAADGALDSTDRAMLRDALVEAGRDDLAVKV